jgi:GMP synthase-like glutamine amidotransferase
MLSCEDMPPYGPSKSTGNLFLQLVCDAILSSANQLYALTNNSHTNVEMIDLNVVIEIYRAQLQMFPSNWDEFHGVLIPGSFSSAYETMPWIEKLKEVIQEEIHAKQRKTMGVCFGHQIFSHSFQGESKGLCTPCPSGQQAGRRLSSLSKECMLLLQKSQYSKECDSSEIELIYTHGDMVKELPSCAVPLFGDERVPIQAAAYFANDTEAELFQKYRINSGISNKEYMKMPKPYAFTFQAHPEYCSNEGMNVTFTNVVKAMGKRNPDLQPEFENALKDTKSHHSKMKEESVGVMVCVGRLLGWFR